MPIIYAGIDLTPSSAGHELAAQFWHEHRIEEWEHQAYFVPKIQHLPVPYPPRREAPRIGVLHWPVGASQWGICHLVATGDQVTRLRTAIGVAPTAKTLTINDGTTTISTSMYLLPPRPINQKSVNEWYMLTLVDERWWWYQAGDAQLDSDPASWTELLTNLFSAVGVTPSLSSVPAAYGTPHAGRWNLGPQPVPLLIDAVCRQIGMRCVRTLGGVVSVVDYTAAAAADTTRWTQIQYEVLAGGRLTGADLGRAAPASVDVLFFDDTTTNKTLASLALADYGGVTGVAGKTGRVTADAEAASDSYATQAATDYYNWFLALTDCTLRALHNIDPNGLDGCVEWLRASNGEYFTRVIRPEWSDRNIYGEKVASADGTGTEPEYQDYCINGSLVRRRAYITLDANGLTQTEYTYEIVHGVPCSGGVSGSGLSGSGAPFPIPDPAGELVAAVELVCPVYGSIRVVDTTYSVVWDDDIIHADAAGGAFTITLPDPTDREPGSDRFIVKKVDSTGNAVTIEAASGNVEFGVSVVLAIEGATAVLYHDGVDWYLESLIS